MRSGANSFDMIGDTAARNGLVFACPHAGTVYPADMRPAPALSPFSLRRAEDACVDQLIAGAAAFGIPLLIARIGRAYVDLNRAETDRDPALTPDWPLADTSARARAGYGVVPRQSGDGRPLYDRRLTRSEVERRIAEVHRPYHASLADLMQQARRQSQSERALLIDWHSMPQVAAGGPRGPDVVLGDRHGQACLSALTRLVRSSFERQGMTVALNQPYAGGWTTQTWGRPADGYHALQIELNRGLYWNEDAHEPSSGWDRCHAAVDQVIADLARFDA